MNENLIKEAIELIEYQINIQEQCKNISHANIEAINYEIKKYQTAIEALEKQLPKKLEENRGAFRCANCGALTLCKNRYCKGCGQCLN